MAVLEGCGSTGGGGAVLEGWGSTGGGEAVLEGCGSTGGGGAILLRGHSWKECAIVITIYCQEETAAKMLFFTLHQFKQDHLDILKRSL